MATNKVTKKPTLMVATGYRNASNYSKLVAKAKELEGKKGTYSQKELVATLAKHFSHRKVSKKRDVRTAWQQDAYVVFNPDHKSNGGKSRWEGPKDNGKVVLINAETAPAATATE